MLAYCLLLSLPIWYVAIPVLFYTGHYFSKLELQIGTGIITIILVLLTIWGARAFTHWFERRFPSLFDNEVNVWKSIWAYLIIFVLVILFLAIISALIMFLLVFRGLL
jgi:hypothetical protein